MSSDTAEIVMFSRIELDWLWHALRNVQARTNDEGTARQGMLNTVEHMRRTMQIEYAVSFHPSQMLITLAAVIEGRCRNGDETLIQHRVKERIEEAIRG